jgi:CheY-like chemotaxis protein
MSVPEQHPPPTALIIEDDDTSAKLLSLVLSREGYRTKTSSSVLSAFEVLRRGGIDIVLMDLGLPGMDGITFTRRLRTYPALQQIPIVAITGYSSDYGEESALRAGCDGYLAKPISTRLIADQLREITARKKNQSPHISKDKP